MLLKKAYFYEALLAFISVILMALAWWLSRSEETTLSITFWGLAFLIGGFFKAKEGVEETLAEKSLNVEILMILAALGAFLIGYYSEGAVLIIIFSISGVLESYTSSKSEKALTSLLKLAPKTAHLLKDGEEFDVDIEDLKIDDVVIVKVGEQVPVDGIVLEGESSVDQQAITGEFMPVFKKPHDDIYAGAINLDGVLRIKTMKDPKDSVVQKIVEFVKTAQENVTPTQTSIHKFERYYVYVVILMAILVMVIPPLPFVNLLSQNEAIYRGIIVLVVGSPCALVASVSPAMLSSLSNAARKRILIKGGSYLENLKDLKAVVFDKTGTITQGIPKVIDIRVCEGQNRDDVLSMILTLELQSNHPLAQSIVSHLKGSVKPLDNITSNEVSGHGIEAKINGDHWQIGRFAYTLCALEIEPDANLEEGYSLVPIIKNGVLIGHISLEDTLRPDAKATMIELKNRGITPIMLTGDHKHAASKIAQQAAIDTYYSECFPEDKVNMIKNIKDTYGKVMMVGDGINDAPALQIADVGCAMGTGADVSIETADIIFMNDELANLTKLIDLSKRARNVITQNIIFSISVIVYLLVANLFGSIELPIGVVFHEGSTILVILNSLRLLIK